MSDVGAGDGMQPPDGGAGNDNPTFLMTEPEHQMVGHGLTTRRRQVGTAAQVEVWPGSSAPANLMAMWRRAPFA